MIRFNGVKIWRFNEYDEGSDSILQFLEINPALNRAA